MLNESQAIGTLVNEEYGSSNMTWDEAIFTWDGAVGTWDNPYTISNESQATGSLTNET